MFTLPPRPPKDYVLRDVAPQQRSSAQFTPDIGPRVTQTNFGIFCAPIPYKDDELPTNPPTAANEKMVEKWTNEARADWVPKPGVDDYFLHAMHQKYTVENMNYNPRYQIKEKIFNRSFKYERECAAELQRQKLLRKNEKELRENLQLLEKSEWKPPVEAYRCKNETPFWYQHPEASKTDAVEIIAGTTKEEDQIPECKRWQSEPNVISSEPVHYCQLKYDMQLVGQPFRSEACNWYYKNYPPPALTWKPKRFV